MLFSAGVAGGQMSLGRPEQILLPLPVRGCAPPMLKEEPFVWP